MPTTLFPDMDVKLKKSMAHDPRIPIFMGYWQGLWMKKYPNQYIFRWAADGAIVKRLLQNLDQSPEPKAESLVSLQSAAQRLFNGHLKWYRGKESIGAFSKHINHLLTDDHGGSSCDTRIKPTDEQLAVYDRIAR